ncbi:response regulator [Synechococcus sp. PCC 7336]|uniref:response regulator n=1 Tax=Synechococcus sp. PCC 7336 TaxID=195250 RepID=UPI00057018FE|nr:response regulator [Synechococcus sp. PCC 7336]
MNFTQSLTTCTRPDFTGILEAGGTDGQCWKLRFFRGRLVGDAGGSHPRRRWQRQFTRFAEHVDLNRMSAPVRGAWNYGLVEPLERQGIISQKQLLAILQGSAREVLFEIALEEHLNASLESAGDRYTVVREQLQDFEGAPLASMDAEREWSLVQQKLQAWIAKGLATFHPNLAPTIRDPEQFLQATSETAFNRLKPLLNGQQTLWDIALRSNRPLESVLKSLSTHIRSGSLELVSTPDGFLAPSSGKSHSNGLLPQPSFDRCRLKIAYLDDAVRSTQIMGQIVRELGYQYLAVNVPVTALTAFLEYKPDIIFLDLVMPVANGYEICAQLRRIEAFKETPIFMVTGSDGIVDRVRSKLVGATGFISKPVSRDKIEKTLSQNQISANGG